MGDGDIAQEVGQEGLKARIESVGALIGARLFQPAAIQRDFNWETSDCCALFEDIQRILPAMPNDPILHWRLLDACDARPGYPFCASGEAEALVEVRKSLNALRLLMDVTGEPGLLARHFTPADEKPEGKWTRSPTIEVYLAPAVQSTTFIKCLARWG